MNGIQGRTILRKSHSCDNELKTNISQIVNETPFSNRFFASEAVPRDENHVVLAFFHLLNCSRYCIIVSEGLNLLSLFLLGDEGIVTAIPVIPSKNSCNRLQHCDATRHGRYSTYRGKKMPHFKENYKSPCARPRTQALRASERRAWVRGCRVP